MLKIDRHNPFNAQWNKDNEHLNPCGNGLLENIILKVMKYALYIPNTIVATYINPRSATEFKYYYTPETTYHSFSKEIITPDQVHLVANVHLQNGATEKTATVLLFNPLGINDGIHDVLKDRLIAQRCNVITFDYRGWGSTSRAEDFIVDGDSVYQYAINELGVNKNKLHFYGYCLGGALATQVKALHPDSKGKFVSDRQFKSVFSLITENFCIDKLGSIIKKITLVISAILFAYPIYLLGWEWDGSKELVQLKGDKRVVYHPNDCFIPPDANLTSLCKPHELIRLDPYVTGFPTHYYRIEDLKTDKDVYAHCTIAHFFKD